MEKRQMRIILKHERNFTKFFGESKVNDNSWKSRLEHFTRVVQGAKLIHGNFKNIKLVLLWRHASGNIGSYL